MYKMQVSNHFMLTDLCPLCSKTLIYKKMMLSIETTFLLVEKNLDYTFHSGLVHSTAGLPQNACCMRQFSTNCTFHTLLCPFISLKEAIYLLWSSFVLLCLRTLVRQQRFVSAVWQFCKAFICFKLYK